jgi:YesN/AraC family two-component response regulator
VVTAGDGRTALQVFRQRSVDAVLLDVRMPDMGGLEVLRQMQAIDPRVDVILVTAIHELPTVVQGIRSGAVDYITKPFETDHLLAAVALAAGRHSGGAEIFLITSRIGSLTALEVIVERTVTTAVSLSPTAALNGVAGQRPRLVVLESPSEPDAALDLVNHLHARYHECPFVTLDGPSSIDERLERVVAAIARIADMRIAMPRVRRVVIAAAEHVGGHYQEKLLGSDVARAVGASTERLGQAFNESLGITLKEFITRFRISAACHLLADADHKLEHIAELTGFEDASHLSRVFVRQRGIRPGEYRRRLEVT